MENVQIWGGDGYLGWPTAMYLSKRGYEVTVVDNYLRRDLCEEIDAPTLYKVPNLIERAKIWKQVTGLSIKVVIADLSEPNIARGLLSGEVQYDYNPDADIFRAPDTIVHYAEQPSAPYSLLSHEASAKTILNNLSVTTNLMLGVKDLSPSTHIIKLGTMGEYGTPNIDIEEGWLNVKHNGREQKFLFPRQGGSIYHTTKVMDTDLLWFGVRIWNLRVTDLMQGPVYGLRTPESDMHPDLKTIFNYDEIFGTVINRFAAQAIIGYPLTVYGEGGQTRGYLNINDTLQCIEKSLEAPAQAGELRIFNQIMETFSVNEIAQIVKVAGREIGIDVNIKSIKNPRKEAENHYYNPRYQGLQELGVKPHYLTNEVMVQLLRDLLEYEDRVRPDIIFRGVNW